MAGTILQHFIQNGLGQESGLCLTANEYFQASFA